MGALLSQIKRLAAFTPIKKNHINARIEVDRKHTVKGVEYEKDYEYLFSIRLIRDHSLPCCIVANAAG